MRNFLLILACVYVADAQSIDVRNIAPLGVIPGQEVVVTLSGDKVENAEHLWTSFPAATRRVGHEKAGQAQFAVTCAEKVDLGIGAAQLSGPGGLSEWVLVLVDDLPAQGESGEHHKREAAQEIKAPAAIDASTREDSADFYKIAAREGESFSIEVLAHRIGSSMDAAVSIFDERGREFFFSDDADGSKDSRFRFTAPRDATYTLQMRDIGFAGGNNYHYRLRIGDFPLVSFTLPRMNGGVEYIGPHVERGQFNKKHSGLSGFVHPEEQVVIDRETADSEAPAVELPGVIFGRFNAPGDHDHYRFAVKEGERLTFQSQTRSFGSPCDAMLKIVTLDGELVAEANPGGPLEVALTNKFQKGGEFILQVQELAGGGGSALAYRIEARKFAPGFTLGSEAAFLETTSGGTAKVKVTCARFEYDGPIAFTLDGAGEGIRIEGLIPEKKNEAELKIEVSDEWEPGQSVRFRIVGEGKGTGSAQVSTAAALKKLWPLMLPPAERTGGVVLARNQVANGFGCLSYFTGE